MQRDLSAVSIPLTLEDAQKIDAVLRQENVSVQSQLAEEEDVLQKLEDSIPLACPLEPPGIMGKVTKV